MILIINSKKLMLSRPISVVNMIFRYAKNWFAYISVTVHINNTSSTYVNHLNLYFLKGLFLFKNFISSVLIKNYA